MNGAEVGPMGNVEARAAAGTLLAPSDGMSRNGRPGSLCRHLPDLSITHTSARSRGVTRSPLMSVRTLALALALGATASFAQSPVPSFDLDRVLSPDPGSALVLGTGDGLRKGTVRLSLIGQYQHQPLVYRLDGERVGSLLGARVSTHLGVAWAVLDQLELGLQLPIVLWQGGDALSAYGVAPVAATVLGAPVLQARYTALRQSQGSPVDLGVTLGVSLPLGSAAGLTRDPGLGFALLPRLGVAHTFGPWVRVGGELGAVLRGQQLLSPFSPDVTDQIGSMLSLGVTGSTLGPALRGELTVRGLVPMSRTSGSVEILAGARSPLLGRRLEVFLVAGPGLGTLPGTPLLRVMGGVAWTPLAPPVCAENEPYRLADCASLDRDGDGVANGADICPEHAGLAKLSGCADTDDDADGVLNLADACPKVAGRTSLGGCLPPDADADGVPDADDRCPREAGVTSASGCADADTDGLADAADDCPAQAGPLGGCPDGDGDGIADGRDACPTAAAPGSSDGCAAVAVVKTGLALSDKVQFELNRDVIAASSLALLDTVADTLKAHPELSRLVIEGHTDDLGPAAFNRALSLSRAQAVRRYLIEHGVDAARIEAKGFGPDRPLTPNTDSAARERNRRVEFTTAN